MELHEHALRNQEPKCSVEQGPVGQQALPIYLTLSML